MGNNLNEPTLLNRIERAGALVAGLLLLYRILFGTGLDFFLLNAFTLLAVFYLWFGFFLFNRARPLELTDRRRRARFDRFRVASSIVMGLVYSVCLISILYAVFFYPRMQFMLGFSFFLLGTGTALTGVYHRLNREKGAYLRQFYRRTAILALFIGAILLIPVEKRLEVLYRQHPGFVEAYKGFQQEPESPEALERLRYERSKFR
jgi:hypothetical protein